MSVAKTNARPAMALETAFGIVIALLVVSGCIYLTVREGYVAGNVLTASLASMLGGLTLLCVARDVWRRQLSLTSWWVLVAAFQVVICVALA